MHMDFGGAQTEVCKEGHSLYNCLHICSPTGVPMQVHIVGRLLHTDTDVSCEFPRVDNIHSTVVCACAWTSYSTNWCFQAWTKPSAHAYLSFQSINLCFLVTMYSLNAPEKYLNWSFVSWTSITHAVH